ncbi:ABC transporter family protein, partial [Vibrio parahaemolyticus V-223/04]
TSQV